MKVTSIEIWDVNCETMPYHHPVIIRVNTDEGISGVGEVGLAYGGGSSVQKVSFETLAQLLGESDSRTLRQFLINTFDGLGPEAAERILKEAEFGSRQSPGKLKRADIEGLHAAMRDVNLSEGLDEES